MSVKKIIHMKHSGKKKGFFAKHFDKKNSSRGALRIAMFGHKRVPSREGGIEVVVEELAAGMASRGHRVTVYNRSGHHVAGARFDKGGELERYRGFRIKKVWTVNRRGLAAVTSSISAAFCCAFGRYDVVHIHAEGPSAMCWLPRLFGKKVVVTIHGLDWQRSKWGGFASRYIKFGEKCAAKFARHIIVLSRGVQKYFQDTYGRKTVYIPNGVRRPQEAEPWEITDGWGLDKNGYVLFLGRLVPEKGLGCLIEAWKSVKTDKKLVIAGGSSDSDDFVAQLKKNAPKNVIFTGFVQGRPLEELFSNAYMYVLPSDLEGMPLSLLEAMSYGCACLVSDIPECTEVVGSMAEVFCHSDVRDLADKLQGMLDSPEWVGELKSGAADYICEKYSWDSTVESTLELYRR